MSQRILVPLEASEVGLNALQYAIDCFPEATITVLNVKSGMVEIDAPMVIKSGKTLEEYWLEDMIKYLCEEMKWDRLPPSIYLKIETGAIVKLIKEETEKEKYDFIVMGTRDKYNLIDKWLGTVSLGVIKSTHIPVYLIPRHSGFKGISRVLIASDHHMKDSAIVKKIHDWNSEQKAFIKFLHVSSSPKDSFAEEEKSIVHELFEEHDPEYGFEIVQVLDTDTSNSLLSSAYNFNAELIVLFPDDQSFFNTLLFKSVSKDVILESKIPLLFMA